MKKIFNNPIFRLLKFTWKYSESRKRWVYCFLTLFFIANCIALLEPLVIGRIFNNIQFDSNDPGLLGYIVKNLILLVLITVGFWTFHGPGRIIELKNAFWVRYNYRTRMFKKVLDLSPEWHRDHHSGDTIDKINKASENLFEFSRRIFRLNELILRMFGSLIILAWFDFKIALIAIATSLFSFWLITKFDHHIRIYLKEMFKKENYLAAGIHDYITNILTIITLRLRPRALKEIIKRSKAPYTSFRGQIVINEWKWFAISFIVILMTVAVLILNAYMSYTTQGVILIGVLFTIYRYLNNVSRAFYEFGTLWSEIIKQDAAVSAATVIVKDFNKIKTSARKKLSSKWQQINIKNLNFKYKGDNNARFKGGKIENINMEFKKGDKIALIGKSGSGKSTILVLLRGLYQADSVDLEVNGTRTKQGLDCLRSHVTLIPQDPDIFNNTIKYNISMGMAYSEKEIKKVLRLSRFEEVVSRFKKGLNTNIMEKGVSLSGGEKQRLALARGLLAAQDSDIVLLDEPTSSVDTANEVEIFNIIFKEFSNKTILASVHRLFLLEYFDYIYYFKDGKILTQGSLHDLQSDQDFNEIWKKYTKNVE